MTHLTPWLSDAEIDDLCDGRSTNAARTKFLAGLGLTVNQKPNGRPLVMRAHAERVLSGLAEVDQAANEPTQLRPRPDREALIRVYGKKAA